MLPKFHKLLVTHKKRNLFILLIGFLAIAMQITATPMLNIQTPAIVHTIYGADKFYTERKKAELSIHITPYFQHTKTGSQLIADNPQNGSSKKVPLGNMLGRWNMLALMYNPAEPIPATSALGKARTSIITSEGLAPADSVTEITGKNFDLGTVGDTIPSTEITTGTSNQVKSLAGTFDKVEIKYERLGLRGQTSFDFAFGLGMTVKGGLVDYKQIPKFVPPSKSTDSTTAGAPPTTEPEFTAPPATTIASQLTLKNPREAIADQFCIDLCEQRLTTLEDTHIDLHWSMPFKRFEGDEYSYTLAPFFSLGVWIPTGVEKNQDKVFSLPTGNDGYMGGTAEASINFDFPKMFQIGFGGGVAFFPCRTFCDYRMPTSQYQVGMIPWKTSITRRPGEVWYFNLSMKSDEFEPGFSFFGDYIFTQHTRDDITLNESDPKRLEAFKKGLNHYICKTSWKAQNYNLGIKYSITSNCAISLGAQGYINGIRTYRTSTIFGSFMIKI